MFRELRQLQYPALRVNECPAFTHSFWLDAIHCGNRSEKLKIVCRRWHITRVNIAFKLEIIFVRFVCLSGTQIKIPERGAFLRGFEHSVRLAQVGPEDRFVPYHCLLLCHALVTDLAKAVAFRFAIGDVLRELSYLFVFHWLLLRLVCQR